MSQLTDNKRKVERMKTKRVNAYVYRTKMCGGGTSYDVYFLKKDKPSYPLHNGHIYATIVMRDDKEFFDIRDAISRKETYWGMEAGLEKWDAGKRLEKVAHRLALRIARRAFPELKRVNKWPTLWCGWNEESALVKVPVKMALPE